MKYGSVRRPDGLPAIDLSFRSAITVNGLNAMVQDWPEVPCHWPRWQKSSDRLFRKTALAVAGTPPPGSG
jgi:hypothetical protein